jgi:hypothetical protein
LARLSRLIDRFQGTTESAPNRCSKVACPQSAVSEDGKGCTVAVGTAQRAGSVQLHSYIKDVLDRLPTQPGGTDRAIAAASLTLGRSGARALGRSALIRLELAGCVARALALDKGRNPPQITSLKLTALRIGSLPLVDQRRCAH